MTQNEEQIAVEDYCKRFHDAAPNFDLLFNGTLRQAVTICWPKNRSQNDGPKLLLLFVQKGTGEHFREFVNCLCSPRVNSLLKESFVCWGWDVEFEEKRNFFVGTILPTLGDVGMQIASFLDSGFFPKLFVINKVKKVSFTILLYINEKPTEDQLFLELEMNSAPVISQVPRQLSPMSTRNFKKSSAAQDSSGHTRASTVVDRMTQRQARLSELKADRLRGSFSGATDLGVPLEPPKDDPRAVTWNFIDRKERFTRRFSEDDTVEGVLNYLISLGYSPEQHKFFGKKCRTDIGKVSKEVKIKSLRVGKEENVNITEVVREARRNF